MEKYFLVVIVLLMLTACKDEKSVNDNHSTFKSNDYMVEVDQLPEVVGGVEAIQKNLIYPSEAKSRNIEGKVVVKVYLDESGEVVNTEILKSDNKLLEQSAIDALERTKFTPGNVKGESVKTQIVVPIFFKLNGSDTGEKKENKYPDYLMELDVYPMPVGGIEALSKNVIYPDAEKKKGIQGKVIILALISETGEVVKTEVVQGVNPSLNNAAVKAIEKTKFEPAIKDNKRVKAQVQIPVSFKLN